MKKILIMGMALLLVGCSQQTQAETNPITTAIETTVVETTTAAETTTAIATVETESNNHFTEEQSLIFEVIIDMWRAKTDNEKIELQKEGLIGIIKESLPDFTDTEYNEMADYILSQYPIPEVAQTKSETKTETKSQSETKANSSNTNNSSNTTQPAPQPTESVQQPTEPVYQESEISAEEWAEWERVQQELEASADEVYVNDHSNWQPGDGGYDPSGDINLGGGM